MNGNCQELQFKLKTGTLSLASFVKKIHKLGNNREKLYFRCIFMNLTLLMLYFIDYSNFASTLGKSS